jgi:molecular chaperone HtpG
MEVKKGKIQISSENMMPIIKKWLYSDKDIFLREIVANGIDAITKYKKLVDLGEIVAEDEKYCIKVYVDQPTRTLTVEDNGIGMTAEEVEKYITRIAFSGAEDFLKKYENASGDGIIGHFGLGFYSAYMVSEVVEIFTKSYKDEPAVASKSDGESTYTITQTEKASRGTKIVMHIAEGEDEFLKKDVIEGLLKKYCSFMPFEIYLNPESDEAKPINDCTPLYLKKPSDCTDEEYKSFYKQTFNDFKEPLFWIHLNMEYPFRLKGILYFPQINKDLVQLEKGQVKLYCNQVFIADNIKKVIPEFLMLLNGVIECPDIPLNVSRSFLQNDRQVQKITKHIIKKVADKLTELYNTEKGKYEEYWKDISTFVKFGCIREEDFFEKVENVLLFKNLAGEYRSVKEYGAELESTQESAEKQPIYYVSDEIQQAQYIAMFKEAGMSAILADTMIDPHFLQYLEYKQPQKWRFVRIDAEIDKALMGAETNKEEQEQLVNAFKESLSNKNIQIRVEQLKSGKIPAVITVDEFMRRMGDMQAAYGMEGFDAMQGASLVLNLTNPVISGFLSQPAEKQVLIAHQVYYLAMLSYKTLKPEELSDFVEKTTKLLFDFSK